MIAAVHEAEQSEPVRALQVIVGRTPQTLRSISSNCWFRSPCAIAHAMCRAACYQPEQCDNYIDPEGYIGLDPCLLLCGLWRGCHQIWVLMRCMNGISWNTASHSFFQVWTAEKCQICRSWMTRPFFSLHHYTNKISIGTPQENMLWYCRS